MRKLLLLYVIQLILLVDAKAQINYISLLQVNSHNQAWNYKMLKASSAEVRITLCTNGCADEYVILKYMDDGSTQKILIDKKLETKNTGDEVETEYLLKNSNTLRVEEYTHTQTYRHQSDEYRYKFVFTLISGGEWGSTYANKAMDSTSSDPKAIKTSDEDVPPVKIMPKFNGDIFKYLSDNIHYPESERNAQITGTVYVSYVIDTDGSVTNVKVVRGVLNAPGLDSEAIRVISTMPKWTPGTENNKPIKVQFNTPIHFELR
jgi:TonB family protein